MQSNLSLVFGNSKKDILFNTAMGLIDAIKVRLALRSEGIEVPDLEQNIFHKIYADDPKSPTIYFASEKEYFIFYPPHSTPYTDKFQDKCKFVEVLSGAIFDANSDLKLFKGDRIKIHPKDNYAPHTLDKNCILRVCIGNCDSLLDQVCR
jgi:hypothetical protein